MDGWTVKSAWIFYTFGAALVAYVLYMMVRRRRGERPGVPNRELEL